MSAEVPSPIPTSQQRGLPPVAPPSGRFIVQLFVVPGLIVLGVVMLLLAGHWMISGDSAPDKLVQDLRKENADVRWPAAEKLTQLLKRDDNLASDPKLALELTSLLQQRIAEFNRGYDNYRERREMLSADERTREQRNLQTQRRDVQYLIPCLGNFVIPAGAPLLAEIAKGSPKYDVETNTLLRRQAVWSLSLLGKNLERFKKLPEPLQKKTFESLERFIEADTTSSVAKSWAELSQKYLLARQQKTETPSLGVIASLAECAYVDKTKSPAENDLFLRKLVVQCLTIWDGNSEEDKLIEATLRTLATDDGYGEDVEIKEEFLERQIPKNNN